MEEKDTADYVEQYLRKIGLEPKRIGGKDMIFAERIAARHKLKPSSMQEAVAFEDYGITAMVWAPEQIRNQCETVAIRAEMDALAVLEESDVPWKSGREGIMHACGHDAILATVLVLAKICVEYRELLKVNIKFIFQPAEENGRGTLLMLGAGVMNEPPVKNLILLHYVNDGPSGVELHEGASSAAIGSLSIKIKGKASHWCTYDLGVDTILAAGEVLHSVKKINESYHSESPFIIGVGTIRGGTAKNVVAGETVLEGSLRACRMKDYHRLRNMLLKELERIQKETGTEMEIELDEVPIPPIINDNHLVKLGLDAGEKVFGKECRLTTREFLSGDSAALYFDYTKGIFFVFTAEKMGEKNYPLHNGRFDFDESVMWKAAAVLHEFVRKLN